MKNLTALIILDGFGINPCTEGNAIVAAGTPNVNALLAKYPNATIGASGMDVGLPAGQMGNSEVGHTNIGAGRVIFQELTRISKAILDGDFFENPVLIEALQTAKQKGKKLHLMGLVSDGGVHSHSEHLYALLALAKKYGVPAYVHCFMDGRDVPPTSGKGFLQALQEKIKELNHGQIATVMGRYWAMDRDNRWERVVRAYNAMTFGEGEAAECPICATQAAYDKGETDEFIQPIVITQDGQPVTTVEQDDSIIFFNFRPDRAREISRTFIDPDFTGFERKNGFIPIHFVSMTQYDASFEKLLFCAYKPQSLDLPFGEYLAQKGMTQLRIAETEKYAHVTFFFNGGVEEPFDGEDRALIPSPKVATYDLKPEMSAYEVTEEALERIHSGKYDVMILNYANPDMVGHTGVMEAAVAAVTTVDICVGKLIEAILAQGGRAIVTADHGNAEQMIDYETGGPYTAHTVYNRVPIILVDDALKGKQLRNDGCLADIVPTMLQMMGLEQPEQMTGKSIIL